MYFYLGLHFDMLVLCWKIVQRHEEKDEEHDDDYT
jgi:hypothetical protein